MVSTIDPDIVKVFNDFFDSQMEDVHTVLPGEIQSYSGHSTRRATVKPLVNPILRDGEILSIPPIDGVPVQFPGSSKFNFLYPLENGDKCLILFTEYGIGNYLNGNGKESDADDITKFSYADAVCIPGVWPFSKSPVNAQYSIELGDDGVIKFNKGSNNTAREGDSIQSTAAEDATFWAWIAAAGPILAGLGVVAPVPTSLTGKITDGTSEVQMP